MRLRSSAVFMFAAAIAAVTIADALPPERTLRVTVEVNTRYDDSAASLNEIRSFISFFPPKQAPVTAGENVSRFVVRQYGVDGEHLPKTYRLLAQWIKRNNPIEHEDAPIGRAAILAPPLPKRTIRRAGSKNVLPEFSALMVTGPTGSEIARPVERPEHQARVDAGSAVLTFTLDRTYVAARTRKAMFASSKFRVTSEFVAIQLQPPMCGAPPGAAFPDASTRTVVAAAMAKRLVRRTYLFVVDTGWPTAGDYDTAVQLFETTLASMRKSVHLATYVRAKPAQFRPLDPRHSSTHVWKIADAVKELRAADAKDRVHVIYVPLGLDQGDDDFFRNLLETYFADLYAHSPEADGQQTVDTDAQQFADDIIAGMRQAAQNGSRYANSAVIEAIYMVADAIAKAESTNYFVNESWTLSSGTMLKFASRSVPLGITVVAPPNDGCDFTAAQIDFAQRCVTNDAFIAVMNTSPSGEPQCQSPVVPEGRIKELRVVGFDGNLTDTSGTSFAAPRVAWLLALEESTLPVSPQPAFWASDLIKAVKAARPSPAPKWRNVWFDVQKYFARSR